MPDNRVDSILLEIEATTDKADGGIDKVTKALTSMKKITEGLDTEKLKQILDVMRGFSGVGDDLKNAGSGMRSIASSIKSLSGVDTAKLKEVAATVKEVSTALGNLGSNNRVSIRIDSEGAQRRVQPLENGQQAAAATESVATASEEAQAAMNGAASAASQLAQEESNLGTAGQSAAAGQTNLNESLNHANTNPANRRIQELIDQINKYKATVSGMESGKIRFDTGQYEEAVNGLRQAQEQFKQFKETVSQSPKNMEDVAKSIKSIGDAAQKCGLGTFSSILSGIASILPAIETGGNHQCGKASGKCCKERDTKNHFCRENGSEQNPFWDCCNYKQIQGTQKESERKPWIFRKTIWCICKETRLNHPTWNVHVITFNVYTPI